MSAITQTRTQKEWDAAVEAKVAEGKTRAAAVIAVSREQPELRQRLVAEANR